jgi:phage tail-like protein
VDGSANAPASAPANGAASSYLQYLPAIYQKDPFLGRFLLIFESILGPIEETIDQIAAYLDPRLTPAELLPWLASWVGLELDENWPPDRQRALVGATVMLYRWRGTRRALRDHLRIYTGREPLIVENFDGLRLGQDASLGVNTSLGVARQHHIAVTVTVDQPENLDEQVLRRIIELEKPPHAGYTLTIRTPDAGSE